MAVNLTVEDRGCGSIGRNFVTIIAYLDHPELRRIFAAQRAENAQGSPAETCVSTKTRPCPIGVVKIGSRVCLVWVARWITNYRTRGSLILNDAPQ
jgi:hypothetical protein